MTEPIRLDFPKVLDERDKPAVGLWNRLEGRPRTTDFGRALRAEVRDPLWLLTRQWQLGEFRGVDAGSPVTATYTVAGAPPSRFRPDGGPAEDLPTGRPLEAVAERRSLPFTFGQDLISFDLRLAIGRRWLKLIAGSSILAALQGFRQQYVKLYPIALPDPQADPDTPRVAHPEVWATMQAISGRRMDGYLLYQHIKGGGHASDGIDDLLHLHYGELDRLGGKLVAWLEALVDQPTGVTHDRPNGDATWDAQRLEHRFSVSARTPDGSETVLASAEYPGGLLDWHAFSIDPAAPLGGATPGPGPVSRTVFPAPVRYSGMPLPRWWALEDGRTNFAAVSPDSTDLARLIFLEFALVYSNDWFQLPCELPAGTLATIRGLAVTDVFGQKLWITPAGTGDDQDWQRWSMFTLDIVDATTASETPVAADTSMLLPPSVPKVANGPALEEVLFIRDEMANMVWGIEQTIRLPTGEPRRGSEVAAEILAHRLRLHPPAQPEGPRAAVAYEAMTSVPENWIPFIPAHVGDGNRSILLQRAAMPSVVDGLPVHPRTALLREGFDAGKQYFVNEEEVPQAGTRLSTGYNRTRWADGRVVVWLSARRGVGRGEGSSGLAFDILVDTGKDQPS